VGGGGVGRVVGRAREGCTPVGGLADSVVRRVRGVRGGGGGGGGGKRRGGAAGAEGGDGWGGWGVGGLVVRVGWGRVKVWSYVVLLFHLTSCGIGNRLRILVSHYLKHGFRGTTS